MKRKALLIGINKYTMLGPLQYARQDAESFKKILIQHYHFKEEEIQLMTCKTQGALMPLAQFVELALIDLCKIQDLDLLVFGFWGHGCKPTSESTALCMLDTYFIDEIPHSYINLENIKSRLKQVGAVDTLMILDCCQDRPAGRSVECALTARGTQQELVNIARNLVAERQDNPTLPRPTVAILNSCSDGQKAYEWDARKHGIFTTYLLGGMKKGISSVSSLAYSIGKSVGQTAWELHRQNQTPYVIIEGKGDIYLLPDRSEETLRDSGINSHPITSSTTVQKDTAPKSLYQQNQKSCTSLKENRDLEINGNIGGVIDTQHVDATKTSEEFHVCPECGLYNQVGQTFRCVKCGRDYLCTTHYDEQRTMCKRCVTLSYEYSSKEEKKGSDISKKKKAVRVISKSGKYSIDLTYVEGGSFQMSSDDSQNQEFIHSVTIHNFYLSTFEVTQDIYEKVMGDNPSKWKGELLPVEQVTWFETVEFANALSLRDGLEPVYIFRDEEVICDWSKMGYRLPTEAEWEYAARGGRLSQGYVYAGSNNAEDVAWLIYNSKGRTQEVGLKKSNELGLYDMCGNVWEWCWDCFDTDDVVKQENSVEPEVNTDRVLRGGSYISYSTLVRSKIRSQDLSSIRRSYIGFRLAVPAFKQ